MRFVAEVNRRCSVVSRDCAGVTRSSGIPGKRSQDVDKLPKTMMAFVPLAQSILSNQERVVVVKACQPLLPAQSLLSAINIRLHVILHRYSTVIDFIERLTLGVLLHGNGLPGPS